MIERKRRVRLSLKGQVQGYGVRYTVNEMTKKMGISGFIENEEDGTVTICVEGSNDRISQFIDLVQSGTLPGKLTECRIDEQRYLGDFTTFTIK